MKTLGPYGLNSFKTSTLIAVEAGEFGWIVSSWVGYVRKASRNYTHTIICCRPENWYLYADFGELLIQRIPKGKPDRWLEDFKKHAKVPKSLLREWEGAKVITPTKGRCMSNKREYRKYGTNSPDLQYDLIIHARAVTRYKGDKRNHGPEWYSKLLQSLPDGLRVGSMGTVSHHIKGTDDLRGIKMSKLCDIMASSRLIIGPSSGPMHLASHCGCPHLVWTTDKFQKSIGGTNKDRYKKLWNPFNTKVKVIDKYGWKPPVDVISEKVRKMICA